MNGLQTPRFIDMNHGRRSIAQTDGTIPEVIHKLWNNPFDDGRIGISRSLVNASQWPAPKGSRGCGVKVKIREFLFPPRGNSA